MTDQKNSVASSAKPTPVGAYPKQNALLYINLSVFWFALDFLWAGMITIVIQQMVQQMVGEAKKDLYLGVTLGVGALVSTLVCLIVGTMSDRSRWAMGRRRPYIIFGTLLSIPAILWLAQVKSIPLLILDFCLIQLWVNAATSPYQAVVPDMVPKERQGTASAYMGVANLLGQLGGLWMCKTLVDKPGGLWSIMVWFSVLLTVCMLYTVWKLPERSAADNSAPHVGLIGTLRESFQINRREYPDFMRLISSRFMINMGFYTCTEFLLYYVAGTLKAPNPGDVTGLILIISTVSGLIGSFPAGILSDRLSKKSVIYASNAITAVAVLCFIFTNAVTFAYAAAFVFGIGLGAFLTVDWAFATNLLPERDEAKYMGIWHISFTVPQVVAPLVGGVVAYYIKMHCGPALAYRVVFMVALVYFAIGTTMIHSIREKKVDSKK